MAAKKRKIYWTLGHGILGTTDGKAEYYGLFFSDSGADFKRDGSSFSKGFALKDLTEEKKAAFNEQVAVEMDMYKYSNNPKWIEVKEEGK